MENKRATKRAKKEQGILISFARSIGSTLGSVATKTDVFSKAATGPAARAATRTARRRKSASLARKARKKNKS